ncbi:MAG: SpoIID/LytB domain-containing protein, partial [Acidimicrobiia bacterium]
MPFPAAADTEVTVSGGGWGHGIGMSQYGAKNLAESGMSATEIIQYFYTGVAIESVGTNGLTGHADPLWIGLLQDKSIIHFTPVGGSANLCLGADCSLTAPAGEEWSIRWVSGETGKCQFYDASGVAVGAKGDCEGSLTWTGQPSVGVYLPGTGNTYGRGEILIKPALAGRFNMVVELGLEEYLYGLAEMPSSWHTQALGAQAIAGRTYALYKAWVWRALETNQARMEGCSCHLYATTSDQKYVGMSKETEVVDGVDYGAKWVAAVDATSGQAATHASSSGRAIQAYYFSSSGGATENNEDAWGGSPLPYLRSVPDPGAWDFWTKSFTPSTFASLLGFVTVDQVKILGTYDSGAPTGLQVTGTGSSGAKSEVLTGNQFRTKLTLKSHYVTGVSGVCQVNGADGDDLLLYRGSGSYQV